MPAAFPSRFSRWWCWLISQVTPAADPMPPRLPVAESPPLAEIIAFPTPKASPTPEVIRASQADLIQTLLETVRQTSLLTPLPDLAPAETTVAASDPSVRARTLAALQNLQQIPSLQSLARSFSEATNREDASVAEVVEAVQKDPALCVRVLRLANSVTISPVERIDDILSAVQMLGILRVRKAAHALFTLRDAQSVAVGFDWRHLWIHGLATAAIAEELEQQLGLPAHPHLHLAALLHDVGKIVLSTVAPDTYRALLLEAWNGRERLAPLEASRLGVSHGEAGVIFAEHCKLHPSIVATIAHHADPAAAGDHALPAALVSIANFVSKSYGLGFSGARLDETDGDFESLPAWTVIAEHRGSALDREALEENLRRFIIQLKPELRILRES